MIAFRTLLYKETLRFWKVSFQTVGAPVLTSVTAEFTKSHPSETEFLRHMSFPTDAMNELLAWKEKNGASAEEAAAHFLTEQPETWSSWLSDDARQKLSALIAN